VGDEGSAHASAAVATSAAAAEAFGRRRGMGSLQWR
jgi:hypothetical protein